MRRWIVGGFGASSPKSFKGSGGLLFASPLLWGKKTKKTFFACVIIFLLCNSSSSCRGVKEVLFQLSPNLWELVR
jgi:hypothetical protein